MCTAAAQSRESVGKVKAEESGRESAWQEVKSTDDGPKKKKEARIHHQKVKKKQRKLCMQCVHLSYCCMGGSGSTVKDFGCAFGDDGAMVSDCGVMVAKIFGCGRRMM